MPGGRKPDLRGLPKLRGTDRKDRQRPDPPPLPEGRPEPPEDLTDRGRHWFNVLCDRLAEQDRLSPAFTEVLTVAASRRAQIEEAEGILAEEGSHYECVKKDGETMYRSHPMLAQRNEAQRHLQSLLAELGLTPASLHKVANPGGGKKKNAFEALG